MSRYVRPPDLVREIRALQAQVAVLAGNRPFPLSAGVPTHEAEDGAVVIDTTGLKLYARVGGAWVAVS